MASRTELFNKEGKLIGYRIRVLKSTDSSGKKKFYSENWYFDKKYKSEDAMEKAYIKEAGRFEAQCKNGDLSTEKKTLSEYCRYYIELKDLKPASESFYSRMLPAIDAEIGYIKLKDLRAEHLDNFYKKLGTSGGTSQSDEKCLKLKANKKLINLINARTELKKNLCIAIGISENTLRECIKGNNIAYKSAEKIAAFLSKPIKEIFVFPETEKGLSSRSILHYHSFLFSVLKTAVKKGTLNRNVAEQATPPKMRRKEQEFFEASEILKIREIITNEPFKYQMALAILADTGIRRGELCGLCWKAVNFEEETITINKNVQYIDGLGIVIGTTKTDEARTIHVSEDIIQMLEKYLEYQKKETKIIYSNIKNDFERAAAIRKHNPEGYLFTQEDGSVLTPNAINQWMVKMSEKTGFHIYPHKFRHTHASLLIPVVDVVTVSKRLGHKQVSTTQNIYAHLLEKSDKMASDKLTEIFAQAKQAL